MKRVIVESPYAGNVEQNTTYARACVSDCLHRGESALASHLLYTQPGILRDEIEGERELGIRAGLAWLSVADYSVYYTDRGWSRGMLAALHDFSLRANHDFRIRSLHGAVQLPTTLHEEVEKLLRSKIELYPKGPLAMNEKAMNNLTTPLLAAINAVRNALAEADISAMNLRITATGRTDGDLNVQFLLCKDYDADTAGSSLAAVVSEHLRRLGWNQRHAPLCLPNVVSEENCPGHVASEHDPKVCGLCGTHIDSLRPDVQADDEIPF